jgi:hypothetical protein
MRIEQYQILRDLDTNIDVDRVADPAAALVCANDQVQATLMFRCFLFR